MPHNHDVLAQVYGTAAPTAAEHMDTKGLMAAAGLAFETLRRERCDLLDTVDKITAERLQQQQLASLTAREAIRVADTLRVAEQQWRNLVRLLPPDDRTEAMHDATAAVNEAIFKVEAVAARLQGWREG